MTSHCADTVPMREEPESGIRKWEGMWFKTSAKDGERGGSSDVRRKTVPQTSGCNRKRSVAHSLDRRVHACYTLEIRIWWIWQAMIAVGYNVKQNSIKVKQVIIVSQEARMYRGAKTGGRCCIREGLMLRVYSPNGSTFLHLMASGTTSGTCMTPQEKSDSVNRCVFTWKKSCQISSRSDLKRQLFWTAQTRLRTTW